MGLPHGTFERYVADVSQRRLNGMTVRSPVGVRYQTGVRMHVRRLRGQGFKET
jgi:hypothetical protein